MKIKLIAIFSTLLLVFAFKEASAVTLNVPQSYPTLMDAYNAAKDGDVIMVAPGTYPTCLTSKNKRIALRAQFPATTSPSSQHSILNSTCSHVVQFSTPLTPDGNFTLGNHVEFNGFVLNGSDDGFSYEGASGLVKNAIIQGQTDDPVDVDGGSEAHVIGNILRDGKGGGDGLENRLHSFSSSRDIKMIFMNNIIYNNRKDGIQLIGIISGVTKRKYLIANNLIINNVQAGIGTTANAVSEQTQFPNGHPLPEKIYVINNTFVNNGMAGILGGANMKVHNNIFYQNKVAALKNVSGASVASYNLFFGNAADNVSSNVQSPNIMADPKFMNTTLPPNFSSYQLGAGSPAINAGMNVSAMYQEFGVTPPSYNGAPDLGWKESGSAPPPPGTMTPTPTTGGTKMGDVNADGMVNILDFQLLSNSFGKSQGQAGYNANADFNNDSSINVLDFQILSNNFGS